MVPQWYASLRKPNHDRMTIALSLLAMKRVMIQADRSLLERARRAARERGITFPHLVREAIEHELGPTAGAPRRLSCVGAIRTDGRARKRTYEPDTWRSS